MAKLDRRFIKDQAVNEDKLDSSVAGDGLNGGAGSSLSVDSTVVRTSGTNAFTADQSMGNNKLTNLAAPLADNDAVRKIDLDSVSAGLDPKESCRLATTADLAATYNSSGGAGATGQFTGAPTTIDGTSIAQGDRILVKNQTDAKQNGIYVVTATTTTWDRASDQDGNPSNEVSSGNYTYIELGAINSSNGFVLQGDGELTLNTNDLVWVQFSGTGLITAGNGLSKAGNTLDVNVDDTTIEISTDALRVKDAGIDENKLNSSVAGDGLAGGSGTALSVNVDDTTIEINLDSLRVKDSGIDENKLSTSVAGNGLTGGGGTALAINVDGQGIELSGDQLIIELDGSSLSKSASGLKVTNSSSGDLAETAFTALDNTASATDITGLAFANGTVRSFKSIISIVRGSTYSEVEIKGIQKAADWDISEMSTGDLTGVEFSITTSGQLQYTTTNTGSNASLKFRAWTTSV